MKSYLRPLISVIVPIYNVERYLEKCIASIVEQTYSNIEIILVDDGSTDNSSIICDEFAKNDHRIKVIHKDWGGVLSARKVGVNFATGEYLISVDGDDWIEKERLEYLANQILSSSADMVYISGYWRDIEGGSRAIDTSIVSKTYFGEEIREKVFPLLQVVDKCFSSPIKGSLCMWAIKKRLLQEKIKLIDDRISMSEDHICVWFCLLEARIVSVVRHLSYHYIQRNTSLTYSKDDREKERMTIWHCQLRDYIKEYNGSEKIKRVFTFLNIFIMLCANYEMLLLEEVDYLFPYSRVKKGSKIVVYGAGKVGRHIIRALNKRKDYEIVLWVDQNENRQPVLDYKISSIQDILYLEYDFIVVATVYEDMSLEIKKVLLSMGVDDKKIATMDPTVITEDYLDKVFEYAK